jgi:hypothetical protein
MENQTASKPKFSLTFGDFAGIFVAGVLAIYAVHMISKM